MKVIGTVNQRRKAWLSVCLVLCFLYFLSGCWFKDIDTSYYTQDTSYYCGAASAQMILDSENLGIYVTPQSDIYNYIHSHNICPGWASDPEGLKDGLNHFAGGAAWFAWYAPTDQDAGNNKLAYTIDRYGVPPAALIYGSAHWVVVRGVLTSDQPTTSPAYDIYNFVVNDPWYGSTSLGGSKWVDIRTWNDDIFTGGSWCGAPGSPRFISVVDPEPPTKAKISYPQMLERRAEVYKPEEIEKLAANFMEKILSSKTLRQYYDEEIIRNLSLATVGTAKLARRLDREKEAYYTVPLIAADGADRSLVQGALLFDAYRGQFKEMSVVPKAVSYAMVDNEQYARKIFEERFDLRSNGVVKLTDFSLVWMPSNESRSPFHPFWRAEGITRYSYKPNVLAYMDQEGKIFDKPTPLEEAKIKGGGV